MDRSILHLDLDTFFVSVERLMDSRLSGKPIIFTAEKKTRKSKVKNK
jgi:nucleotidyltransferase/DNA polymerase involved in DNA repair